MIYLELFFTFFKIGLFTFGGGYAMIPLIQSEVLSKEWLSASQLVDFIAVSESSPGPFAVNIATYVGMETTGILGSVCATIGIVLPSFIIILIVAKFYQQFKNSFAVKGAMTGLKPAVIGLIGSALISIGTTAFFPLGYVFDVSFFCAVGLFLLMFLLAMKKIHPILIIVISAVMGIIIKSITG